MIPIHDVINKLFSYDLNDIVDMITWQKFTNCSIYMKEVIISIL